jgi:hypothetical protein
VGDKYFLFIPPVWTSPVVHPAMYIVGNDPLSWEYSSQGMELITHRNLVLILRISTAIPLLYLFATIGMLQSDIYLRHMCGWLFMNSFLLYQQKKKITKNKM